ncbi:MAG: 50S ribosomal protein L15 [Nitrospirae bacterium]|nr:50S ribosomal protein L15 [Nitrospirota bacterium]MBF0541521.1 50S ribosomal protein L15 [Nitrospirota bacterium]
MKINELKPKEGSTRRKKRIGRGPGSGHGKTSCHGHKGQKARSGRGKGPGFEGGQMPLQRRLPKRGFNNSIFASNYAVINLDDLDKLKDVSVITPEILVEMGQVRKVSGGVKILARGELTRPLTIKAHAFSKTALTKITSAGGKAEVV